MPYSGFSELRCDLLAQLVLHEYPVYPGNAVRKFRDAFNINPTLACAMWPYADPMERWGHCGENWRPRRDHVGLHLCLKDLASVLTILPSLERLYRIPLR